VEESVNEKGCHGEEIPVQWGGTEQTWMNRKREGERERERRDRDG